jgi:hypothetical protein
MHALPAHDVKSCFQLSCIFRLDRFARVALPLMVRKSVFGRQYCRYW